MFKQLCSVLIFLSVAIILTANIEPAVPLTQVQNCTAFAGENAMQVANGSTHLTFLEANRYIKYAKILPDNTCFQSLVDDLGIGNVISTAPTLSLEDGNIIICYCKNGVICKAVSSDGGVNFTVSEIETVTDPQPIIRQEGGLWRSFLTACDSFENGTYAIFTNIEESTNGTNISYVGMDVIYGAVRSNSDIWIRQSGGGSNNGWPTFYGPVYTSGTIHSFSGTPPYAQVFHGGYYEHVPLLNTETDLLAWQIQHNGHVIYPAEPSSDVIMFVTVTGSSFTSWKGQIVAQDVDSLDIYSNYPPGSGTPIGTNYITKIDTVWTPGPSGNCADQINIVNSPLWISGTFSGTQVWYSPFEIKIKDNILLADTPMGQTPASTSTDKVALVTDKQIIVQYGYKDPADGVRYHPNCDSDADGVFIYASLYALIEDPQGNPRRDGCFTFEYQHPHPSVPAVVIDNVLYDKIDLHRRVFPQTEQNHWPPNIDYPWYNPLWPEGFPFMERGTIHLYGNLYQQRRGFVHRNVYDAEYPNPYGIWDIENDLCGGTSGTLYTDPVLQITFYGINAPNTTGAGVGYKKDCHNDARINPNSFSFNPFGLGVRYKVSADGSNWNVQGYKSLSEPVNYKYMDYRNAKTMLQMNNHLFWQTAEDQDLSELNLNIAENDILQKAFIKNDNELMLQVRRHYSAAADSVAIVKLNPLSGNWEGQDCLPLVSNINNLFRQNGGQVYYSTHESDGTIRFYAQTETGEMQSFMDWNPQIAELGSALANPDLSRLNIIAGNADSLFIIVNLANQQGTAYNLYYAKGYLEPTVNPESPLIQPQISVNCYPNPFKEKITVRIETDKKVRGELAVYNIKGQKVKTLLSNSALQKGKNEIYWNGVNEKGNKVSAGLYLLKGKIDNKTVAFKILYLE